MYSFNVHPTFSTSLNFERTVVNSLLVGGKNEIKSSSIETEPIEPTCPLDLFWNRHAMEYPPIEMERIESNVRSFPTNIERILSGIWKEIRGSAPRQPSTFNKLYRSLHHSSPLCRSPLRRMESWETLFFLKLVNHLVYTRKFLETKHEFILFNVTGLYRFLFFRVTFPYFPPTNFSIVEGLLDFFCYFFSFHCSLSL